MLRSIWSISSLLIGMGLLLVGSGLLGMVIGLRGVYEGFSNLMIGLIMSGYYVGYIAGGWICPILIRRVGHVRCFASFAALSAALTLAFGMVVDPWVWLVLRVFNGLALMGIYMVIESWLNERSQATPGSQASIFAVYMVVNLATVAIGQYFVTFYGATAIESFIIAAILFCMGLLPIALTPVPQPLPIATPSLSLDLAYVYSDTKARTFAFPYVNDYGSYLNASDADIRAGKVKPDELVGMQAIKETNQRHKAVATLSIRF